MGTDETPISSRSGIDWAGYQHAALLFYVHDSEPSTAGTPSATHAAVVDIVVLDGEREGTKLHDVTVPRVIESQLKSRRGGMVLGRLYQAESKDNQRAPFILNAADEAAKALARAYLAKNHEGLF